VPFVANRPRAGCDISADGKTIVFDRLKENSKVISIDLRER
jgi:hypothetical protein